MKISLLKGMLLGKKRGRREEKSIILCCSDANRVIQIHKMCMQNICFDMSIIQADYICISVCANKLTPRRAKLHPKAAFFQR